VIRIDRGKVPAEFRKAGGPARQKLYRAHKRGRLDLEFDRDVYALAKPALVAAQHEKCAFCEAKIRHTQPGDVEHFRPQAATRQSKDAPLRKPGYYWLAYEWTNLLLACAECNRRGKGNLFPLRDDARRAHHHRDPIQNEEPCSSIRRPRTRAITSGSGPGSRSRSPNEEPRRSKPWI
jgi:hypothetical protein